MKDSRSLKPEEMPLIAVAPVIDAYNLFINHSAML